VDSDIPGNWFLDSEKIVANFREKGCLKQSSYHFLWAS